MYMNTKIAKVLSLHKSGIYKTLYQECQDNTKNGMENLPINIQNHIKIIKNKSSNYS